jgi:hypothetical protein
MSGKSLVLRTCDKNLRSHGGFQWPKSGPVEAPDWSPEPKCGGGLHGLLWGAGNTSLTSSDADAVWMVVEVDAASIVDLGGKIKFPRGVVVYCGDRAGAVAYIVAVGGPTRGTHWSTVTGGDRSTVKGGDWSTVTGGDESTVTGGYRSTVKGGDWSTVTGGDRSTVTGGYRSTVKGGYGSVVSVLWRDGGQCRRVVAVVDGQEYLPNITYRVVNGRLVPATEGGAK